MKTFIYIIEPRNKGKTTARVYRIKQAGCRAHNLSLIGLCYFNMSGVPKDIKISDSIVRAYLESRGKLKAKESAYIEAV